MELFQVLQNIDFEYIEGNEIRFIQAWKQEGSQNNQKMPILEQQIVRPEYQSPEQSIIREKIPFLQHPKKHYLVTNASFRAAFCAYNSKRIDIVTITEDESKQRTFQLDEYIPTYSNQGITAIQFATPTILTAVSLNFVYIIPLGNKINQIMQVNLHNGHSTPLRRGQKHSVKTNFNIFNFFSPINRIYTIIRTNERLCLVSSTQSTVIYVVDLFSFQLVNQLNFNARITCFDLNNNDQVLVGLSNQTLHFKDLRSGEFNDYYFKQNVVCVAFQNFSFVQTLRTQPYGNLGTYSNNIQESHLSGSSTLQQSILDRIFDNQDSSMQNSNLLQESQNLAVFALHNDIILFQLNVKQQKIVKTFDFSSQLLSGAEEIGGKIHDVKWKDCCLCVKFNMSVVVGMLYNTSLVVIGGILGTEQESDMDAGQVASICHRGLARVYVI